MVLQIMEGHQIKLELKFQCIFFGHNNLLHLLYYAQQVETSVMGENVPLVQLRVFAVIKDS